MANEVKDKMTLILFSGELDKALAAFTLATTAASSGMDVTIFFTFWGLNLLKKNSRKPKKESWMNKMLNMVNKGLPLSRLNMFGMGSWMMKKMMREAHMASLEDLMKLAKQLNVKYIACTTSCAVMGLGEGDLIEGVTSFAGAATYLAEARESKVNLFI